MKNSFHYFNAFAHAVTAEQLARFVWVLNNRPAYKVPVALYDLIQNVNRELVERTEWSA